ncbi:hypothetical protein [Spartinivicinus ruber]|uniref:hypothetical protein n=1 Tax=Spartinivicinus ruber TaxID=2683272 RepID=UPI0013D242ED|nr:hypothetical protein [Spartinivicinus ruber]
MRWCLSVVLGGCLNVALAADQQVYIVGKFQLQGTSYAQAAFFRSDKIANHAVCEEELQKGQRGEWDKIFHVLRPVGGGASYTADYRCVTSNQFFEDWRGNRSYFKYNYLVEVVNKELNVQAFSSPAKCLKAYRKNKAKFSSFAFCGKSNQAIKEK